MKSILLLAAAVIISCGHSQGQPSEFGACASGRMRLDIPGRGAVGVSCYERIYYVSSVEDSAYQFMNIYVPDNAVSDSPILLKNYISGYRASAARRPQPGDLTGRALWEGMVVCIAGARGSNSFVVSNLEPRKRRKAAQPAQEVVYTGKIPAAALDLKAAIRYLRAHDQEIPGRSDRIVSAGTDAGGALSALLGAAANHPDFEPLLARMGAARASDGVYASVCFSPVFIGGGLDAPGLASEYCKKLMMSSVREAASMGADIPDSLGAVYFADTFVSDDRLDYLVDFDVDKYLACMQRNARKRSSLPADSLPEFKGGMADTLDISLRRRMVCPQWYILDKGSSKCGNWYIRQGSRDSSSLLTATLGLAQMLEAQCLNVDCKVPWGRGHSGDYDLDELMEWVRGL